MHRRRPVVLAWAGAAAVALLAGLALLSDRFGYGSLATTRPIPTFVCLFLAAEALALLGAWALVRAGPRRAALGLLVLVAVCGHLVWIGSEPVQEDDFYRYMWDGHVALAGVHPYRYAPLEVLEAGTFRQGRGRYSAAQLQELDRLAKVRDASPRARRAFARISHADLPTIYPPLSVAVFAGLQSVAPWSLEGLRWTFAGLNLITILLLAGVLRRAGRSVAWVALYAWHPLVTREFINSAHHDVIAMLPLVLSLWLWQRKRTGWAAGALALSVLAKLFALVALPVFLASLWKRSRRDCFRSAAVFLVVVAAGYLPLWGGHPLGSLSEFAVRWNSNEGANGLFRWLLGSEGSAKLLSAILLVLYVGWRAARAGSDFESASRACGAVVAALFLLSPVQQPWYAIWFLPFLALYPSGPLLLMTATVSLYYLHFLNRPHLSQAVLWVEHAPVWIWLGLQALFRRPNAWRTTRSRLPPATTVPAKSNQLPPETQACSLRPSP